MLASRITDHAEKIVKDAIVDTPIGEDVHYEVLISMQPTPQGLASVLVVLLTIRGLGLGEHIVHPAIISPNLMPPQHELAAIVAQALNALSAEKACQTTAALTPPVN